MGTHNYLKTLPESQPVPSWGAALRRDSSQKKTPGNSTEVACCWDCCSSPPQRRCWTHCCSSHGTESPEGGHLSRRVWAQQLGCGEHVALPVLGQEKGKKEARGFDIRLPAELTAYGNVRPETLVEESRC